MPFYSRYGDDSDYQPISFDPTTGAASGSGISPQATAPASGDGTGKIPYYLAPAGTPSDQIDWSTAYSSPTGTAYDLTGGSAGGGSSSSSGAGIGSTLLNIFSTVTGALRPQQQQIAAPAPTSWLLPVVLIGGAVVVGGLLLSRR